MDTSTLKSTLVMSQTGQSEKREQREQETCGGHGLHVCYTQQLSLNEATKGCKRQLSLSRYAYICIFIHTYKKHIDA